MQDQHPIAFISKTLSPKIQLLLVYDRELLTVVYVVEKWYHYLSTHPFIIKTDQKSLKYLLEQRLSTPSQFNQLSKLMGLSYHIQYKKGRENNVADALSRASHGELLQLLVSSISIYLWELIKKEWEHAPVLVSIIQQQQQPDKPQKFKWQDGILKRKGKLVIGSTLQTKAIILEWLHSSPQGGHSRVRATEKMIKSLFYWKGMLKDIKAYVLKCEPCMRCKYETTTHPSCNTHKF